MVRNIYSVTDMSSVVWQICFDKSSSDLCVFNTPFGRYEFLRMSLGIKSAPDVLNRKVFGSLNGVMKIFDDLIIADETKEEGFVQKDDNWWFWLFDVQINLRNENDGPIDI